MLGGRKYTARALTAGDHVIHRFVGQFKLVNGLEVYHRSFTVFNLTLWDDIIQEFGELTDQDVLVRHTVRISIGRSAYVRYPVTRAQFWSCCGTPE